MAGEERMSVHQAGCFEVAIFFVIGAGFKPVSLSIGEAELHAQIHGLQELLS